MVVFERGVKASGSIVAVMVKLRGLGLGRGVWMQGAAW